MAGSVAKDLPSTAERWRAAFFLGLISSTFSTVVSQLSAARIGRDAAVDWMSVATIPARDWALSAEPTTIAVAIGIAFHQWADISWALIFFGVMGSWTCKLSPGSLALIAVPWAILTSAFEWFILVPLAPFWQPIFTLQQPYWIGFLVHLSSASMYPLFVWLPPRLRADFSTGDRFLGIWVCGAMSGVLVLVVTAWLGAYDREIPWIGRNPAVDRIFIRHMSTHHEQGIELASIAANRADDPHLRALAKLMAASQRGEVKVFSHWWTSWFDEPMQICSAQERAEMPGLLDASDVANLRSIDAGSFDHLFVELMTRHHRGAVAMADFQFRQGSDPRLKTMAQAIRHEQQGEIALMHGIDGGKAVSLAFQHMFGDIVN